MNYKKHFYTNGVKSIKLSDDEEIPEGFYKGRTFNSNPWNRGLTKEDTRVAKYLENNPSLFKKGNKSWNEGLTKETDERLKIVGEKNKISCKGRKAWNRGVPMSEEAKEKLHKSHMGKSSWNKGLTKDTHESVKSTSEKLKGHPCFVNDWAKAKEKEYSTHKKNNSFNSSKPEDNMYLELVDNYGVENVIRGYRDKRYPFNCDFYIISEDLFIEYQGTWLHGRHPFDINNEEDVKYLNTLKSLAKEKDSYFYKSAVYVWSDLDVRKLKIARDNKLNFKFIYPNNLIVDK